MNEQQIFDYIKKNLKIHIMDKSEPSTCGGEVGPILGVAVQLWLTDPRGNAELIDESWTYLG